MSTSVERYLAAARAAGSDRHTFNAYFIGSLSGSDLTDGVWDAALAHANEMLARDSK